MLRLLRLQRFRGYRESRLRGLALRTISIAFKVIRQVLVEVDEVVIVVKIIHLDAAFGGAVDVVDAIVVVEICGGAQSGRGSRLRHRVDFIQNLVAGPAAAGPVRSKRVHLWGTILDGTGTDRRGLLLGVAVHARIPGAGDGTATNAASAGQRALNRPKGRSEESHHGRTFTRVGVKLRKT